jgi:transcriptional regulator MraZ
VFVGTSERKLDDKGRIVLPAALRDELHGLGYVAVADRCLAIWTDEGFRLFTEDLRRRVREGEERTIKPVVLRKLAASTDRIRADSQGRVTLPAALLLKAGIGSGPGTEVVVNGALDRIEIWAPDVWQQLSDEGDPALDEAMREQGL